MRDEPKKDRQRDADDDAGNDRKVEGSVFAAVHDVPGQFSKAEGELAAEIEESTDEKQEAAEEKKRAAKFAERIHEVILSEAASHPTITDSSYYSIPTIDKNHL